MATEEVNKPPSLPPYPEMVLEAIDTLQETDGSNKTSISKYIESKYGDIPGGHTNLLSIHLNKMKASGVLVFSKNNYARPDPNAPPKRGRGRPPKPRTSPPPGVVVGPARPRGRPRKDSNSPPPPKKVNVGPTTTSKSGGRGRGRPPKVKTQVAEVGVQGS